MSRELIGYVGVDSGTLIIVDPCYLHDFDFVEKDGENSPEYEKL